MKITDKEAIKELKRINSYELYESIEDYPDDERDGRTDEQILVDEVSWIVSCFNEGGHCLCESLEESRQILKETKNGKVILLNKYTFKPMYSEAQIKSAKDTIKEFNHLVKALERLNAKGIYGSWQ